MKIGIDISQIAFEGTGVATYTRNLVQNLLEVDHENEYVLFGSSLRKQLPLRSFTSIKKIILPLPPTALSILWNDLHILAPEIFTGKIDIFHSSDWTQPPTQAKKITTIHDLVVYKYPGSSHPKIIETHKKRLAWVKKECDLIIVDSEATKKDCVEILNIPEQKLRVVYLAAGKEYTDFSGQTVPQKKQSIENVKNKYSLKKKYILAVGTREPRKNLERLTSAFEKIDRPDTELVIAGKFGWGSQSEKKNVRLLGFVPQEDLPALYAGADVFAYPSLYEGFGFPILEAMSVGCPVLTSDCSSMPELGGNAALYVDPTNEQDITAKLIQIQLLSGESRKKMVEKGYLQSKMFSWEKTAKGTLAVYRESVRIK